MTSARSLPSSFLPGTLRIPKTEVACALHAGPEGLSIQVDRFNDSLRAFMCRETRDAHSVHFDRQTSICRAGDPEWPRSRWC